MNTNLEHLFIQKLNNDTIKVVSFDIFDTLAFRKVANPKEIFKQVGKKKIVKNIFGSANIFRLARIEAEKSARKKYSRYEEITLRQIYEQLPLNEKQINKILKLEIQQEYKNLYINPHIKRWIDLAINSGKQIIFISDMYLNSKQIEYLVFSKLHLQTKRFKLFVSNEHQATKATGKLFDIVLKRLQISGNAVLHVGDNAYSDVEMAISKNIETLLYNHDSYTQEMLELEAHYMAKYLNLANSQRKLASIHNPYTSQKQRFFFNFGASVFGPILWKFSHWIIGIAQERGITQINCIMREGKLFKKCIDKLKSGVNTNLVYASRKSTFLPSIDIHSNRFDFHHYRKLSIGDFYELFHLPITNDFVKTHKNLLFNRSISMQQGQNSLQQIVIDDFMSRKDQISKEIKKAKSSFIDYLKSINYHANSITLDFGGSGTVLRNIENIVSSQQKHKINALFYIHESGIQKLSGSHFISFLSPDDFDTKKIELIRRSHEIIEALFNGDNATTLDYKKERNGISPVLAAKNLDSNDTAKAFREGIEMFFDLALATKLKPKSFSLKDILNILTRVIELPHPQEALYLGNLYQEESFSDKTSKPIINENDLASIKNMGIESSFYSLCKDISFQAGDICWVQGTITQLDPSFLQQFYRVKTKGTNSDAIDNIAKNLKSDMVYIYGAGQFAKELLPKLREQNIIIKGFIDSRAKLGTFTFENYLVKSIDDYVLNDNDTIIIASTIFADEITKTIHQYSQTCNINITIVN